LLTQCCNAKLFHPRKGAQKNPRRSKQATAKFKSGHFGRKQASARSDGGNIHYRRRARDYFEADYRHMRVPLIS
jgi:hypothetical protein